MSRHDTYLTRKHKLLSLYVCETLSWKLEPRPLSPYIPQAFILVE